MAKYDVPAAIDYVLRVTESEDLYYVGFSMGTTVFWAMLSERPQYAKKVLDIQISKLTFIRLFKSHLTF